MNGHFLWLKITYKHELNCIQFIVPNGSLTYAHAQEQLGVDERELDDLADLADLLLQAADLAVGDLARVLVRHVVHERVDFARQVAHDRERGHVEGDARARLQLALVQLAAAADYVAGAVRRFHDDLKSEARDK